MKRYDSGKVELPPIAGEAASGELIFYEVDRSGPSFEGRVFVNNVKAGVGTPMDAASGFVGLFTVFGHGGCVGDEGHCDVAQPTDDPFELRQPEGLPPLTKTVPLSREALKQLTGPTFTVTVVAVEPGEDGPVASETLGFDSWRLATYEEHGGEADPGGLAPSPAAGPG